MKKIRKCKFCKLRDTCYGDECIHEKTKDDNLDTYEFFNLEPALRKQHQAEV